jgi:hypothetical protein
MHANDGLSSPMLPKKISWNIPPYGLDNSRQRIVERVQAPEGPGPHHRFQRAQDLAFNKPQLLQNLQPPFLCSYLRFDLLY